MPREALSAAVDNSATAEEWDQLIEAVGRDPELMRQWSRIWAARDARDGVALDKAGAGFCAGVLAALEQEAAPSGKVVEIVSAKSIRSRPSLSWRSLVPLSAAAGMAAAVLFVGRPFDSAPVPASSVTVAASQTVADAAVTWSAAEREDGAAQPMDAASEEVLNSYLMEHSNTLAERSMGGSISNARFVVHTSAYAPEGE